MTFQPAQRVAQLQPSATLKISGKAKELAAQGKDVINFGAGEPDFPTPKHIRDFCAEKLQHGEGSGYTHVRGIQSLREAVAEELSRAHKQPFDASNILVSSGAKHSLYNVLLTLLDPGDEVLIPAPFWVSYPAMCSLAGGVGVPVQTAASNDFQPTVDALKQALTSKTKAIILNSPSNPSGAVYSQETLTAIARFAEANDLWVISDDIYRKLVYVGEYISFAQVATEVAPTLKERIVLIDGVSKSYAMTGWRIGFSCAAAPVIDAMAKLQGQSTSNPAHIAQLGALCAVTQDQSCVQEMKSQFDVRRKLMVELLTAIPEVTCPTPKGAFYAFPDLTAYFGRLTPNGTHIEDDIALCNYLLEYALVAIVPGSPFHAPGHARLSYACSEEQIQEGVLRIKDALTRLKKSE